MGAKGILTKTVEEKLGAKLDEIIKMKGVFEQIDGLIFKMAIAGIDDYLGEKIKEPLKTQLRDLIVKVVEEEDYMNAVELAFDLLDELIDIPGIEDEMEEFLFDGLVRIVIAVILAIKKEKDVED